jgi:hypothetical protein
MEMSEKKLKSQSSQNGIPVRAFFSIPEVPNYEEKKFRTGNFDNKNKKE